MIVNVIHCGLPKGKATTTTTDEHGVYVIAVNKDLTGDELRRELAHELRHLINDDFHIDQHVNLVEKMIRQSASNNEFEHIDFYQHFLDSNNNVI